jgi:hypothetical protein
MAKGPPRLLTIAHDDYHAAHVGRTRDGRQFFLTAPFVPAVRVGSPTGREFLALYLFDRAGVLLEATIDDLGPRVSLDHPARVRRRDELLAGVGELRHGRIRVAPFSITRFGVEFGLIPRAPEEPGGDWAVILMPGDTMCFWPPFSSGIYDT